MGRLELTTQLHKRGPAAAIVLTDEQVATIGEGAKRFPVVLTMKGHTFRLSVGRMGGENLLGLRRDVREAAGVEAGDRVDAVIELDAAERTVDVPDALATALDADPDVRARFDALAFTHRKEFARWVTEAKQEATRERRVAQAVQMIREGRTRS